LSTVSLPNCSDIGNYGFNACTKLTDVSFPACTKINNYAFNGCASLSTVNFPSCSYIGNYAFNNCTKLVDISFSAVTKINNCAFNNCTSLSTVSFPKCSTIAYSAFSGCTNLASAEFSVCSCIYTGAFSNCSKLTSLVLYSSSVAALSNVGAFKNTPMSASSYTGTFGSIYVPASLVDAYKSATNWVTYADRITAIVESGGLITFTIDGVEYQAEEGMTWGEWFNSEYNTSSLETDGDTFYIDGGYPMLRYFDDFEDHMASDVVFSHELVYNTTYAIG
jgi:hypothetical protein